MKKKKTILLILDGFGLGKRTKKEPIFAASTPVLDSLYKKFPHSKLSASGEAWATKRWVGHRRDVFPKI